MVTPTRKSITWTRKCALGSEIFKRTHAESSSLKGVPRLIAPRKGVLHAFVGCVDIQTTEEALSTYLTDVGIRGVVCKKLEAKNGKRFRTAAFYVSCCCESKELFYNERCWPEGVELRDWIFYIN